MPKDHQYTTVPVSEGVVRVRSKGHEDPFVVSRSGFVSYQQFIEGCTTLVSRSHCQHVDNGVTFGMIEQYECHYLSVTRELRPKVSHLGENGLDGIAYNAEDEEGASDLDNDPLLDEAAIHHSSRSEHFPTVEYHIVHSPSYQVPVLYLHLKHLPQSASGGLDGLYEWLIPKDLERDIRSRGIVGGISMGNHPVTDLPAYFVHPCNTAESLRHMIDSREVSPFQYLQIWIGLIGPSVGLYLPKELVVNSLVAA